MKRWEQGGVRLRGASRCHGIPTQTLNERSKSGYLAQKKLDSPGRHMSSISAPVIGRREALTSVGTFQDVL
jgi:hypothetical protein